MFLTMSFCKITGKQKRLLPKAKAKYRIRFRRNKKKQPKTLALRIAVELKSSLKKISSEKLVCQKLCKKNNKILGNTPIPNIMCSNYFVVFLFTCYLIF